MSHIFNKSSHPVGVKRIPVRMWSLRDEIEAALALRIRECEAAGTPLYVDDIKAYYGMPVDRPLSEQPQLKLVDAEAASSQVSNENVDQMMEALAANKAEETPAPPVSEAVPAPAETAPVAASESEPAQKADEIIANQSPEEKKQVLPPHLQRPYSRQVPDSDKISYGFALLSDINMDWILTFSKEKFIQGQSVVIEFLIPRPFTMGAEIMLCSNYGMRSRIISETKPDYRLQCRFTFPLTGERTRLRDFLTSVEPTIPKKVSAAPKAAEEAGPEA